MTSLVDISGAAPLDVVDPLDVLEAGSVRRKSLPAGSLGRLPAGSLGRLPAGSLGRLTAENRPSGGAGLTSRHGEISGDSTNTGSRTAELEQLSQLLPGLQKAVEEQKRVLADVTHTYNWAQTATYETSRFRFPENEAEVVALIKGHDNVRAAGALHSSSPLSQQEADGGIIISTRLLDKVIEIDEASMTVTCEAGCIAGVLFIALEEKGFALSNWGTIDHQTMAGALMTGTHGGSAHHQSTASMIRGCRMVLADGSIKDIGEDDELLDWVFPSLGMLGIVTRMTLKMVPSYKLRAICTVMSLAELQVEIFDIARHNEYTRFIFYPTNKQFTVWRANRKKTTASARSLGARQCTRAFLDSEKADHLARMAAGEKEIIYHSNGEATTAIIEHHSGDQSSAVPTFVPYETLGEQNIIAGIMKTKLWLRKNTPTWMHGLWRQWEAYHMSASLQRIAFRLDDYHGKWHHLLLLSRNNEMPHGDMELMFRLEQAPMVLAEVAAVADEYWIPYYNVECRVIKGDNKPLSQFNIRGDGDDVFFAIDFQAYHEDAPAYFAIMETRLRKFNYRLHWAKGVAISDGAYLSKQYKAGTWQALEMLRKKLDPTSKFTNEHMIRWFGS